MSQRNRLVEVEDFLRWLRDNEPDDRTKLYRLADDALEAIHKLNEAVENVERTATPAAIKKSAQTFTSIDRPPFIKWTAGMTLRGVVTRCYYQAEGFGDTPEPIVVVKQHDGTEARFNASRAGIRYALERAGTGFQVNDEFTLSARPRKQWDRAGCLQFDLTLSRPMNASADSPEVARPRD